MRQASINIMFSVESDVGCLYKCLKHFELPIIKTLDFHSISGYCIVCYRVDEIGKMLEEERLLEEEEEQQEEAAARNLTHQDSNNSLLGDDGPLRPQMRRRLTHRGRSILNARVLKVSWM